MAAVADGIRVNQANFTAASTLLAAIALLCQVLMSAGDTTNVDIDVHKIVVRDDGQVVLQQDQLHLGVADRTYVLKLRQWLAA